jgi:RNase H-like domain found in reverse transcriptase
VIVGQKCSPEGCAPDDERVSKILNWPPLTTVKEVRGFMGLCGTVHIWIKDFSQIAQPLVNLTRKGVDFEWSEKCQESFETLKILVTSAPILHPIDYKSERPVILSVDTSYIAVGFILSQIDENGKHQPARYGSIPLHPVHQNYSQSKLDLYGLFRALTAWKIHLVGVINLVVEMDASYVKNMINNPDMQPNNALNR